MATSDDLVEGEALARHLLADVVLPRQFKGGLVGGSHGLLLLLHGEQPRHGLRPDMAGRGRIGTTAALIDNEGATGTTPERRVLRLRLDGAQRRRAGGEGARQR